jgi:ketosteroid isomerase-like protein
MARTTEQVFQNHENALARGDVPALMADYAGDAVLLTLYGPFAGAEAIRGYFTNALASMPNAQMEMHGVQVYGDLVVCSWSATFDTGSIPSAVDSFVIRDDRIQRQM